MKPPPLEDLLAEVSAEPDPRARLRRIVDLRARLVEVEDAYYTARREAIDAARLADPPVLWREIGEIFGVSPQRAHEMTTQPQPERNTP